MNYETDSLEYKCLQFKNINSIFVNFSEKIQSRINNSLISILLTELLTILKYLKLFQNARHILLF